jgi:5-methylcytosine-specific restriction endonuclease McrA
MFAYCVQEMRLCEQAAYYRIRAARAGRQFPAIFNAVAMGRLNLSTVVLLAPHLTGENDEELLAAATGKSKTDVERLLAERFPRPDLATVVRALPSKACGCPVQPSSEPAIQFIARPEQLSPGIVAVPATAPLGSSSIPESTVSRPKVTPLAPRRYALQLTMSEEMRDDLCRAQELLGHQIPPGDFAQVLHRALKLLVVKLEKTKFATTQKPQGPRETRSPRHIPAHVKRAVCERDGGRCTFVSDQGHRCSERTRLEFDHVDPVARGGRASISGIRLRCRAHNQYEAERVFGVEFMQRKRAEARSTATASCVQAKT